METLIIAIQTCGIIISIAVAVYFFAESQGKSRLIESKNELIANLKEERDDLWVKLLVKNGLGVPGIETKPSTPQKNDSPKILTRAEAAKRDAEKQGIEQDEQVSRSTPVTPLDNVQHPQSRGIVEKAKEIKEKFINVA